MRRKQMFQRRTRICPHCKRERLADDTYCGNCGMALVGSGGNHETIGEQQAHEVDATVPTSSSRPLSSALRHNLRRLLFVVTLVLVVGGVSFALGLIVGKPTTSQ